MHSTDRDAIEHPTKFKHVLDPHKDRIKGIMTMHIVNFRDVLKETMAKNNFSNCVGNQMMLGNGSMSQSQMKSFSRSTNDSISKRMILHSRVIILMVPLFIRDFHVKKVEINLEGKLFIVRATVVNQSPFESSGILHSENAAESHY